MADFRAIVPWRGKSQQPAPRDEPYDPFVAFRRKMDRMFDDFCGSFGGRGLASPFGTWSAVTPTIDLSETDNEIIVTAELPGLNEKDFEVTVWGDVLTLRGEKKAEHEENNGNVHYVERRFGSFSRSVRLPFEVKDGKVNAKFDEGVLIVRVPKPADLQRPTRRINVQTV